VIPVAAAPSAPVVSEIMKVAETLNISVEEVQKLVAGVTGKKRQMILMGPPGTGKTFVAQQIAPLLVEDPSHIRLVQFHPSYGYEDFIEGLRPVPGDQGGFEFTRVPGALVELAEAITGNDITEGDVATRVLIIDEINRANISKVFGELMFLLEYRDQAMKLMLDDREFRLPENLIIIGTMNTADRSIRTLDVAMRRRFRFFELPSRSDIVERHYAKPNNSNQLGAELITGFEKLNAKLAEDVDRHHTIGHSYVLHRVMTAATLREVWEQEIFPLIEDYFFDRPDKAAEYDIKGFWPSV
jgi:5-methylcytosine-specific restriction endonuclease McrBC GTP-binding regulatory subunit McrB